MPLATVRAELHLVAIVPPRLRAGVRLGVLPIVATVQPACAAKPAPTQVAPAEHRFGPRQVKGTRRRARPVYAVEIGYRRGRVFGRKGDPDAIDQARFRQLDGEHELGHLAGRERHLRAVMALTAPVLAHEKASGHALAEREIECYADRLPGIEDRRGANVVPAPRDIVAGEKGLAIDHTLVLAAQVVHDHLEAAPALRRVAPTRAGAVGRVLCLAHGSRAGGALKLPAVR